MDYSSSSFWNKLKKSIMAAPKVQPSSAAQLIRFNNCWTKIQSGFSTPEKRSLDVRQTEIPQRLKNMVDLLVDEESRLDDAETTGVCMEYLLKHSVLAKLVNNAEGDEPKGIMGETIRTIASMINLLDDRFLVHNAVHKPTVKLLRTCASGMEPQGESYHEDLVDLMYIICSKIHGYKELLNIFFHDKQWLTVPQRGSARRIQKNLETMEMLKNLRVSAGEDVIDEDSHGAASPSNGSVTPDEPSADTPSSAADQNTSPATSAPSKSDYEFLLFTYLSKFVHREGKTGDFARTGLLFLMELATGSLGEYIMESDFTSLLSAGVGASYSQLPRKLLVRGGPNTINSMVGTLNDRTPPADSLPSRWANIELSTSVDFQSRLDAFLKLLEFCQDIMMRCPNSEIVDSLLVTFKSVFLENILFPSIMECSDTDGSSVAVISYIDLILQVLEHEALVDLVVGFLMSSDDDDHTRAGKAPQDTDDAFAEVRNSQSTPSYFMASGRFTLKDLIFTRLKSRSQPTVIATLKLLNTLISRHCKYSLKLLSIQPDSRATSFHDLPGQPGSFDGDLPLIDHHVHELDLFYALISTINPHNTAEIFCNGYESYLRDAEGSVETHQCFLRSKETEGGKATPGQLSVIERKKQRRRSMKYGQKMDLPDDMSGESFIREQEKNAETSGKDTGALNGCCGKSHPVPMHRLLPSDPLLQILLGSLSHFFAHSVELNLALTGVITSLAVCPYRSLGGWLLFKSADAKSPAEDESEEVKADARFEIGDSEDEDTLPAYLNQGKKGSKSVTIDPASLSDTGSSASAFKTFPPIFTMLRTLTQQVDYYRSEIDGFDDYLADRRRILLVATELNSAIHTPGLESQRLPHQQHLGSPYGSNNSFAHNRPIGGDVRSGSQGMPTMMVSPSLSMGPGPMGSPRVTGPGLAYKNNTPGGSADPAHRINTSNLMPEGGSGGSSNTINSPMARKSSSPKSLMSSPSNVSFLEASGYKRPLNKSGNFSGVNNNLHHPQQQQQQHGTADSDMQHGYPTSPSMPVSIGSSRSAIGSSGNVSASGSMVGAPSPLVAPGTQPSSWGSFITRPNQTANPMLSKHMDTIMVKPLFPDGFVNDSDSEADDETVLEEQLEVGQSDNEDNAENSGSQQRSAEEGDDQTNKTKTRRRAHNASVGSSEAPEAAQARAHREKKVTLGQLLTNVVILEEVVKEVVAVAQVRRGLGVDKVRFL
ncbi:hypothetical protein BGZ99_008048 [Dissophora globulifera]|uniref:FHF complex subunit HOOK-interacting protein C-terminal domain-containing protein n=1 Tax=Dissophora globulifera TaxID=979702 RepID=A0A9P6R8A1_9FUNG|nr:hypothetical protein BGZ99_008048 [Dissophora globulifera]